ncbi:MAG TPA: hypothetical protein VGN30_20370 [Steroidobacteraceae bacterium]
MSTMKRLAGMMMAGAVLHGVCAGAAWTAAPAAPAAKTANSQSGARWRARDGLYYKRNWGVEVIGVKPVSSGYMLAFRYRVIDPDKAKMLNDRHSKAYLRDDATGTVLAVPAMENVGELRTGAAPQADRTYFMIFGNPGRLVKSGSRVTVVAGNLHVDGLIVD